MVSSLLDVVPGRVDFLLTGTQRTRQRILIHRDGVDADTGRVVDCVNDGRRSVDLRQLANALRAVRALGGGMLDDDLLDVRRVLDAGHLVAGKERRPGYTLLDDVLLG